MQAAPLRALIALVLALLTLVSSGCRAEAGSPGLRAAQGGQAAALQQTARLQEVAPPGAVAAIGARLAEHQPRLDILAPADDTLLPEGPWTLKLRVSDWPLGDTDDLGIGPHLVVQLDQQPPLRLSSAESAAAVAMPPLQPGSHRLTVYAARPWGEAVKSPGALRQIRLHRVSRNSAELPAQGSAQLIVASPADSPQQEPVLLDWLLLDAPLQHLHDDDARWRLRVSVNGDSVLVDRQTPLWLKGFHPGSNAVQLELLDARGDALNPPFNSLVREVVIGAAARPAWRNANLNARELALLSGDTPAREPEPALEPAAALEPEQPAQQPPEPATFTDPGARPEPEHQPELEPEAVATSQSSLVIPPDAAAGAEAPAVPAPGESTGSDPEMAVAEPPLEASGRETSNPSATGGTARSELTAPAAPATTTPEASAEAAPSDEPAAPRPATPTARELVNADGSLVRPKPRGPLAGLREKLGQ